MGKHRCLAHSDLVKNWTIEERAGLAFFLERYSFDKNDSLFLEDEKEQKVFFIESGAIEVSSGQMKTVKRAGESLGVLSLFSPLEKKISATAIEKSLVWALNENSWEALKIESPPLAIRLLESIQRKVADEVNSLASHLQKKHSAA